MQDLISASPSAAATLAQGLIERLRQAWQNPDFQQRHRLRPTVFVRKRRLPFPVVFLLILQQTTRSLQLHLHDFLAAWSQVTEPVTVTPGALTRARAKLRPEAYGELNQAELLPTVYGEAGQALVRRWHGHRVLGVDSSLLRLPPTTALAKTFGLVECGNERGKSSVAYPEARLSILFDVLNHLGWDAQLVPHTTAETSLAQDQHLRHVQPDDLLLNDRGYTGYLWLVLVRQVGAQVVGRCSTGSFAAAQQLFRDDQAGCSVRVTLQAPTELRAHLKALKLPLTLAVRFVTLRLSTGELEVLVTTLLDEARYPTAEFGALYHARWGHETYYGLLKGRLALENWSGKTEVAIRQDVQAAVFLSNLESVLTRPAQAELELQTATRQTEPVQVNHAVCLHALKTRLIALLAGSQPAARVVCELQRWFRANPVSCRPERKVPRKKTPAGQAYHYQKNVRKTVF